MGNYYSGMMNNKDGYGELRHYRTKGSRNGYSTTPGYDAIGKPASKRPQKSNSKQSNNYSSGYDAIGKPASKRPQKSNSKQSNNYSSSYGIGNSLQFGNFLNNYKRNATISIAKKYGPTMVGNYINKKSTRRKKCC